MAALTCPTTGLRSACVGLSSRFSRRVTIELDASLGQGNRPPTTPSSGFVRARGGRELASWSRASRFD
jgi:hypothetical protein